MGNDSDNVMDAIEELLPGYALNALDEQDALMVEAALEREPRYRRILNEYLEGVSRLAGSHAAAVPSAAIRERLMSRVRSTPAAPAPASGGSRGSPPRVFWAVAAALFVAVIGLASFSALQQQRVADLEGRITAPPRADEDRSELEDLSSTIARPGVVVSQLRPIPLAPPTTSAPGGGEGPAGMIAIDAQGGAVLVTVHLQALDAGQTYQAWWWDWEGQPSSAAVFEVDEGGYVRIDLQGNAGRMQSLSVNVESAGGADAPSSDIVLVGLLPDVEPSGE